MTQKRKRCPNGTRKNRKTGNCERKIKNDFGLGHQSKPIKKMNSTLYSKVKAELKARTKTYDEEYFKAIKKISGQPQMNFIINFEKYRRLLNTLKKDGANEFLEYLSIVVTDSSKLATFWKKHENFKYNEFYKCADFKLLSEIVKNKEKHWEYIVNSLPVD